MDPSLHILKHVLQVTKSLKCDNIHNLYLCLLTSLHVSKLRYRANAPKIKLHIHFTESPKRDNVY